MPTDKRNLYNWIMVLLINLVIDAIVVLNMGFNAYKEETINIICFLVFVTVLPTYIAASGIKQKNRFGYGIPLLLLLPIPYLLWQAQICTGKFCGFGYTLYAFALGAAALIFPTFYKIGVLFRKWNEKTVLTLSLLVPALILGAIIWIMFYK